jgi:acylphosphatase
MQKQVHVFYSGRVQGIGFRATAKYLAVNLGITGWVKNLGDGRVEVVGEAEEKALKDFLEQVNKHFSHYIRQADVRWGDASGEFQGFGVEF